MLYLSTNCSECFMTYIKNISRIWELVHLKCLFLTIQSRFHNMVLRTKVKTNFVFPYNTYNRGDASRSCTQFKLTNIQLASPLYVSYCVFIFLAFHVKNGKSLRCESNPYFKYTGKVTTYPKKDTFICWQEQILTFFDISNKWAVVFVQRHQANPCFICKELLLRQAPWEPLTLLSKMQHPQHSGYNVLLCQLTYASSSALLSVVGVVENFLKTQIFSAILHHVTLIRGSILFLFSCGTLLTGKLRWKWRK